MHNRVRFPVHEYKDSRRFRNAVLRDEELNPSSLKTQKGFQIVDRALPLSGNARVPRNMLRDEEPSSVSP